MVNQDQNTLRFTRSGQAVHFYGLGIALLCLSAALFILALPIIPVNAYVPPVSSPYWAIIPLISAITSLWTAAFLARHAYIIFGPLGLEIYPFWFPEKNMALIMWGEIHCLEVDPPARLLTITRDPESGAGAVFISLLPIARPQRPLVARAARGINEQ